MSKFDVIYSELVQDIIDNGVWDKDQQVRTKWADGKPAYTKSVFGRQIEFDEIPISTTKKLAWKTAIKEMLIFWVKQSTKMEDFHAVNCHVWDEWFLSDGTIGRSYPYQFESRPKKQVVRVKSKVKERHAETLQHIVVGEPVTPNYENKSKYIGKIYKTKDFGNYVALDVYQSENGNRRAKIQFIDTNYITDTDCSSLINEKNVKDIYHRYVVGVGYYGNVDSVKNIPQDIKEMLYKRWYYMIKRCYDHTSSEYKNYGNKGVFVDMNWHSFENYLRDVRLIPQYHLAKYDDFKGWSIDKDYYNSNYYGKESCVWLKDRENLIYRNSNNPFYLLKPNGERELYLTFADAEKDYGLSNLNKVYNKEREHVRRFKIDKVETNYNEIYRYKLSRNQVVDLIDNIKNTPSSRRHMTSFWNDADVDEKALQECAYETIWNVDNDKLNLILGQRSLDVGLGCCFNQFQYFVLLHMVAQVCDLKVGKLIHQIGSAHIYERHLDPLSEQIKRIPFDAPTLWLNPDIKNFDDFTINDFKLLDYVHHDSIKMEVAI